MCLAAPGRVVELIDTTEAAGNDVLRRGLVELDGVVREVDLTLVPDVDVGSYVIVHAGYAIRTVPSDAAGEIIGLFAAMEDEAETTPGP